MRESTIQATLRFIADEWAALPARLRPGSMWICMGAPLPENADGYGNPGQTCRAWFLDGEGLRERNVWSYARFYAMHMQPVWDARYNQPIGSDVWGRTHRIGIAGFAKYAEADDIYAEMQYGNLHGRGLRLRMGEDGRLAVARELWVS